MRALSYQVSTVYLHDVGYTYNYTDIISENKFDRVESKRRVAQRKRVVILREVGIKRNMILCENNNHKERPVASTKTTSKHGIAL